MEKIRPKSVVLQSRKKLQVLEEKCFQKKKFFQLICVDIIFKTVCRNFFIYKWISRYLSLVNFKVRKIVLYNKIINKNWLTKNQENSAQGFGVNYLTNHLVKFLQDRINLWRVGAPRVCTGYQFFFKWSC